MDFILINKLFISKFDKGENRGIFSTTDLFSTLWTKMWICFVEVYSR